jgi:bifunctional non-homologous end joining protein LigD
MSIYLWSPERHSREIAANPERKPLSSVSQKKSILPDVTPQLATPSAEPPAGAGWLHEIKYDGYRLLARIEGGRVHLISRNGKDWSDRFGSVIRALSALPVRSALLDGEVAVVQPDGRTRFQDLQNILSGVSRGGALRYFLFDLLHLDGTDWMERPLVERKQKLAELLGSLPASTPLRYADHVEGNGKAFFEAASRLGLEGIVSKRRNAAYTPGRGPDWLKIKCIREEEFVVGGFTDPGGSRPGFGALLLGAYDPATGKLQFTGRVGTGFTDAQLVAYRKRLDRIVRPTSPFRGGPSGRDARGMHWVEPTLVVQVGYSDLTDEHYLRHPTFRGVREDRDAKEVTLPGPIQMEMQEEVTPPKAVVSPIRSRSRNPRVAGIPITNPDKVLYPESGIRKIELAEYYEIVGERMLFTAKDRPLTLLRCPNGIDNCFYQKHIEGTVPDAVQSVRVREGGEEADYPVVDSTAGLVALAQLGVLEIHTWGSKRNDLERPDRFTMDLDPDPNLPWVRIVEAVLDVRNFLSDLGLESFLKTTGGKGLHVVVPIVPGPGWEQVKEFTYKVATAISASRPGRYTTVVSKSRRKGRILLDYLRNGRGATAIEAYSTRARPGATVAVPIRWEELAEGIQPDSFDIRNLPSRLASLREEPWLEYAGMNQELSPEIMRQVGVA